jgi:hypothetical protein
MKNEIHYNFEQNKQIHEKSTEVACVFDVIDIFND